MKKNISPVCSLLLLPLITPCFALSMEKEHNPMAESVMGTPVPTERGLGFIESARYIVSGAVWTEAEVVYGDLTSGKFNSNNSSYHHKLDNALDSFITNKNNTRITETLGVLREKYPQHKITDSSARKTHEFLAEENKRLQKNLKTAIQAKDREFIEQENNALKNLQSSLKQNIQDMRNLQTTHLKTKTEFIQKEGDEIRRIKTGLLHVHKANKSFKLPKEDGYCSDEDIQNIQDVYADEHILEKIKITEKMNETNQQIHDLLVALTDLESKICAIQSLQY
jgi:hypothetical protein